ncbi:MAG: hypothetical protein PWR09_593 [Archaeoglobi archaeon]|nr:hypothetical protein [Archaeoglobi archaeon]
MEGTKRILSIVMAAVMVLSVFAGLAVIPAKAYTGATVLNDSIVMGEKLHVQLTGAAEAITVKAVGVSGDAEGQVVILYSGTPSANALQLATKDIITKSGEYNVTVTNSTSLLGYRVVAVSEPVLTAKLNDATANKDDVSSFIKGHTVYINGTSNAGIEYVRVYDSNNVIKFEAKTSVNYSGGINYWVLADDSGRTLSGLGKGTYTLEVKDKVGTKITKTFEVVEDETNNIPNVVLSLSSDAKPKNSTVMIFVSTTNAEFHGLNLTLTFDSSVISFINVASLVGGNIYNSSSEGRVSVVLVNTDGINALNETKIIEIKFKVIGEPGDFTWLNVTGAEFALRSEQLFSPDEIRNGSVRVTMKGDFNGNDRIDIGDIVHVAFIVVGKLPSDEAADFNGNEEVDIGDLAKIAYYLLGKVDEL